MINLKLTNKQKYRLFEMIPGSLVIFVFVLLTALSFFKPLWVIYFIILYAFLWLVRVAYFVIYLFISWKKYREEVSVDWFGKVQKIENWEKIYHVVFLPHWKEPVEVLEHTLDKLSDSNYPMDKVIVVLGGEERAGEDWKKREDHINKKYKNSFFKIITTTHPKDLPGEVVGKSANAVHMAKRFREILDNELRIPYENIIVSNFDCDTVVHEQYLARLTYAYLTHPNPTRASYQPLALYNNNIWESPSFTRVVANSTTFWLMTELSRPEQFMTFSSHSMSWKALVDVGYWDKTIITEDSRIFLQCYFHYDGEYELVPIYVPINMDTVAVDSLWRTIVNQYNQMKRWAWSVEHQPYLLTEFKKHPRIPRWSKLRYYWKFAEGQFSWATAPLLLTIFSRLPLHVASAQNNTSVLVQNAPFVIEQILQFAMIGMFFSALFNVLLLPSDKPPKNPTLKYGTIVLQWVLLPITLIVFGSIPAIDAQMRLLTGKTLVFWNTEKSRIKK